MKVANFLPRGTAVRVSLVALLFGLAACAGREPPPVMPDAGDETEAPRETAPAEPERDEGPDIDVSRLNERGLLGIERRDRLMFLDPDNPLSTRTIYFEFDSSRIQPDFQQAIQAHAAYLADHPDVRLRLEGHTDERGTREYNVALGERRANAVKQALVIAGARANQLSTLSFGEERPAETGSTEAAYAKNRRVELVYVD